MPNYQDDQDPQEVSDEVSLGKPKAANALERRAALEWCLNNPWANEDVGALERWDRDGWHGWLMWPWKRSRT